MGGKGMFLIGALAVIAGSLIALSGFIIAKKPNARQTFEKIAPYQGFLGVGLLVWGIYDLLRTIGHWGDYLRIPGLKLFGVAVIAYVLSEVIIGFCLGFGVIAKWIPGDGGAEKKGLEIQRKLLGFSMPIGVVGLVSGVLMLYYVLVKF